MAQIKRTSAAFTMTAATNATPIVVTFAGSNVQTGDKGVISGTVGNTAANGSWTYTRVDANSFSLDGSVGNGAWASGGYVTVNPVLFAQAGYWHGFIVTVALGVANGTVYDHASAASGTVLDTLLSTYAAGRNETLAVPIKLTNGLYVAWGTGTGRILALLD